MRTCIVTVDVGSVVALTFLGTCIAVHFVCLMSKSSLSQLAVLPSSQMHISEVYRLVLFSVSHSSTSHLVGNLSQLLLLLPSLEAKHGRLAVAAFLVVCSVTCGIVFSILSTDHMLVGSSGLVFACIAWSGGEAIRMPSRGGPIAIPFTYVALVSLWAAQELSSMWYGEGAVSHLCHFVGGLCGMCMAIRSAAARVKM